MKLRNEKKTDSPSYPLYRTLKVIAIGGSLTAAMALSCAKKGDKEAADNEATTPNKPTKPVLGGKIAPPMPPKPDKEVKPPPPPVPGRMKRAEPPMPAAAPDQDKDGVPDSADKCPNEKGTAANKGCPDKPQPVMLGKLRVAQPPMKGLQGATKDSDGDGVPDAEDRCPNRKGPKSNKGCPVRHRGKIRSPRPMK